MKSMTMRDLPNGERPYEKCMEKGAKSLSDAELLSVILRSGGPGFNSVDLARNVLKSVGEDGDIRNLRNHSAAAFLGIQGIGRVKAIQLECIGELCDRMSLYKPCEKVSMNDPKAVAGYYMDLLGELQQEEMRLVLLDVKNRRIRDLMLTKGTVNASLVSTREMFMEALKYGAVHMILIHNHPSGDPTPSKEDIAITIKAVEAGKLLDIAVLDHIIVGKTSFYSMRSSGDLGDCFLR